MSRYRSPMAERAAIAQYFANKQNGVPAVVERHSLPDSSAFIAANPDKYEVLPNNYDGFPLDPVWPDMARKRKGRNG